MIDGMFTYGAMPALERMVQFTGSRHKVLSHNIANLSTPHFKPQDLSVDDFHASLRDAIDSRREGRSDYNAPLEMRDTMAMKFRENGIDFRAESRNENILFHDRNNRDLERIMSDLAENTLAHSAGVELIRNQFALIETAIRERV